MMGGYTWFTIRTYSGFMGEPKDALIFSKNSTDDDACESVGIEVEDNGGAPFINKKIPIKSIRVLAEIFTKWADELGVE